MSNLDDSVETELNQEDELIQEGKDFESAFTGDEEDEYVVDDSDEDSGEPDEDESSDSDIASELEKERGSDAVAKLEAELEREREANRKIAERLRNVEGRFGSINSEVSRLKEAAANTKGYRTPDKAQILEAARSVDKLDELKEKFPEWGQEVEEQEALRLATLGVTNYASKDEVDDILSKRTEGYVSKDEISDILNKRDEYWRVELRHPGAIETASSEEFKGWLGKQDKSVQELIKSEKSTDAIYLLDRFKSDKEEQTRKEAEKEQKESRLERSIPATSGSRNPNKAQKTANDAFEEGFRS